MASVVSHDAKIIKVFFFPSVSSLFKLNTPLQLKNEKEMSKRILDCKEMGFKILKATANKVSLGHHLDDDKSISRGKNAVLTSNERFII